MSKALGLVRFINSGNIYMGVYNGTIDVMYARIFTPKECYSEKDDCYKCFSYMNNLFHEDWRIKEPCNLSPVEIYSDYGGGFWWRGFGDENQKLITSDSCGETNPYFSDNNIEIFDGTPDWANKFMKETFHVR